MTGEAGSATRSPAEEERWKYRVQPGDTLWSIAESQLGDPFRWPEIEALSAEIVQPGGGRLDDPNLVRPGWTLAVPGDPALETVPGIAQVPSDFNGDGYSDLAVGVVWESVNQVDKAGAVNVIYGSRAGLRAAGDQLWTRNDLDLPGEAEEYEWFGHRLSSGDFDADGFADLVVGYLDSWRDAKVDVLSGSPAGLSGVGVQRWSSGSAFGGAKRIQEFTAQLPGDFNGDGYEDLALGYIHNPDEKYTEEGVVLLGGPGGLTTDGALNTWARPVVVGDFDGDGFDDLLSFWYSSWGKDTDDLSPNSWTVTFGAASSALAEEATFSSDMTDENTVVGDVDADGRAEVLWVTDGRLTVHTISRNGIATRAILTAADLSLPAGWTMWGSVAAGDLTGDRAADLLVGLETTAWDEGGTGPYDAAAVVVGDRSAGLKAQRAQIWSQDSPGVKGRDEMGDYMFAEVLIGRFRAGRYADAAISVPGEDAERGRVVVLRGAAGGMTAWANQTWSQDSPGIKGQAEREDRFGRALG